MEESRNELQGQEENSDADSSTYDDSKESDSRCRISIKICNIYCGKFINNYCFVNRCCFAVEKVE